ncbi:hypothetical protein Zmor_026673 [Zophobas morio]|uniref:Uncharacterized protein n=1 Tax=Zophobas morio TaxID=2755281 RepID=A0AA38HUU0_9CUCU|nr:hypothetical protein Zmor_026673 [Zophobas morio]
MDVLQAVDPIKSGVVVSNTKSGFNGSLIIKCPNKEDVTKIADIAKDKLSEKYVVKELPNLKPRIKVVGIIREELLKDNMVANYIVTQNQSLFAGAPACDVINYAPLKKNSNGKTKRYVAIIQLDNIAYLQQYFK